MTSLQEVQRIFFIGIAGTGMSAIAQFLQGSGKTVSGSDRYFTDHAPNETRTKLEEMGIRCFPQDGSGIEPGIELVVASTAVEDSVPEMQEARRLGIPIIRRAEMLALVTSEHKTIAVGGTSGKSTCSAMIFEILRYAGMDPGFIGGAGLVSIIREGKIGNAHVGKGEWLVVEADESDGSIVHYRPAIGLLLNIDKDHQEIDALVGLFSTFRDNSERFIVNQSHPLAKRLSRDIRNDFSTDPDTGAGYVASGYRQQGFESMFSIHSVPFILKMPGRHNMENALAAVAVALSVGVPLEACSSALQSYQGIYRRHQLLGEKKGIWVVDDYAHNPAKCAASIQACQPLAPRVVAWFQPHGYGPTRFLRRDFVEEIARVMRPEDEIWMSEIFYAGGTASKDISAADLVNDLREKGIRAHFVSDRNQFLESVRPGLRSPCVLLLMGARDPSLEEFAAGIWDQL